MSNGWSMSALPSKADIRWHDLNVRFGPVGDICTAANCSLFDHFVGEKKQIVRDFDAERFGRPQVDYHQKFCGLHDWQVRGLCAFENSSGINSGLSIRLRKIGGKADRHG
jgi:hypothetical protein